MGDLKEEREGNELRSISSGMMVGMEVDKEAPEGTLLSSCKTSNLVREDNADTPNGQSPSLTTFDKEVGREGRPGQRYLDHPQIIDNARHDASSGPGRANYDNQRGFQRDN